MKLYIKNMVSLRCKMFVREILEGLGLRPTLVELGVAEIRGDLNQKQYQLLASKLNEFGLELIEDKKTKLIEKVKTIITETIHSTQLPKTNYSEYISQKTGHDYTYLANIFSEAKGITIEHFIIAHKIEKVKELLLYDELNLTEISYKMNYSSLSHMSTQFKKVTGVTPTFFKKLNKERTLLEAI